MDFSISAVDLKALLPCVAVPLGTPVSTAASTAMRPRCLLPAPTQVQRERERESNSFIYMYLLGVEHV